MKRKQIFLGSAAVLILCLIGWRMWPRTFRTITSSEEEAFGTISVHVSEMSVSDGKPVIDLYELLIDGPDNEHYAGVMSILEGTGYRPDFRNILPWKPSSLGSGSGNISHSAMVILTWGNKNSCEFFLADNRLAGLSKNQEKGFTLYHPADRSTLDQLADYTIKHGTHQQQ